MHGTKGYRKGYCPDCGHQFMISPHGRRDQGETEPVWYFVRGTCSHIGIEQAKRLIFAPKGQWAAVREEIRGEIQEKKARWREIDGAAKVSRAKANVRVDLLGYSGIFGNQFPGDSPLTAYTSEGPQAETVVDSTGCSILPVVS